MVKLTKRKGFNFFRSYYDVYNELESDADKVAFINALLDRQFLGIKPKELKGMAKFAYISQTNSIDSQVKGFEDKTGIILTPSEPPCYGGNLTPCLQVEVEVEVKEKVEVEDEKISVNSIFSIERCKEIYLSNNKVLKAVSENPINKITIEEIPNRLVEFNKSLLENGEQTKMYKDYCSHFKNWHKKVKIATAPQKRRFL